MSPDSATEYVAFDPSVPLHHQIYLQLRHEISDGLWTGRDGFPGERELADRLGVGVITTRAALDRLRKEGWIERRRGRRPRVLYRPPTKPRLTSPDLLPTRSQRTYSYEVLFAESRIAPTEACIAFDVEPGEELWQCARLRRYEGAPHSVTHNAQRTEVGKRHTLRQLRSKPMVQLLVEQGHTIARMRRRFGITRAPAYVTEALGLTVADPVLVCAFTLSDAEDQIVQWVRIYLPPDHWTPDETMDLTTQTWSASERM